ncbi:MAG: putative beta-lysine N-acetyltransferase, partial [Caldithrix sp.]|nr:putative beta-lysine N-acetyltransferase [Caldithrix sp.]
NIDLALYKQNEGNKRPAEPVHDFHIRKIGADDIEHLAEVYKAVFDTYPFPIHDPDYLKKTMQENIVYFGAFKDDRLVAASSCEMDESAGNVEMTDFATLPAFRGNALAVHLLTEMERAMQKRGIQTAYTIARALSAGMNITFAKMGYQFGGTLINNTNISGKIESMNVWYKPL